MVSNVHKGLCLLPYINNNIIQIKEVLIIIANNSSLITTNKYRDKRYLTQYQSQVYSQNNEDGMIAEIFRIIGAKTSYFVEIGVENGLQNNSRFLLQNNWSGVWIEGDKTNILDINTNFKSEINNQKLKVIHSHVTKDNIISIFKEQGIPFEFDFLSIDIDMNTHHIWNEIDDYRPLVACIEYNASIPPSVDFSVPYEPNAVWDKSNYFGAGLKTLEIIGQRKGYSLVGCDCNGVNAFFVRNDLVSEHFLSPYTAEYHYQPPRYNSMLNHIGHLPFKPKTATDQ